MSTTTKILLDSNESDSDSEDEAMATNTTSNYNASLCLPKLPSPLCEAVEKACCEHNMRNSKHVDDSMKIKPSIDLSPKLSYLVRKSNTFLDQLLESIMIRNAIALQGDQQNFSDAAW